MYYIHIFSFPPTDGKTITVPKKKSEKNPNIGKSLNDNLDPQKPGNLQLQLKFWFKFE